MCVCCVPNSNGENSYFLWTVHIFCCRLFEKLVFLLVLFMMVERFFLAVPCMLLVSMIQWLWPKHHIIKDWPYNYVFLYNKSCMSPTPTICEHQNSIPAVQWHWFTINAKWKLSLNPWTFQTCQLLVNFQLFLCTPTLSNRRRRFNQIWIWVSRTN